MRIALSLYRQTLRDLLAAAGVDDAQTETLSENLTWCDMVGRRNHGIERLPVMLRRVRSGAINCPCAPQFSQPAPAVALLDADGGFGHHAGKLGMDQACELASEFGIGAVGIRNSNFYGAGAYYADLAARRGMVGMALSNSFPKVAAHGGTAAVLGTNPLAFAVPRADGRSIIVDMSTAALAGSSVRDAVAKGTSLEPGLAIDDLGNPVCDPVLAQEATLLPAAGAKGFGLAIMVEVLSGVLTGAGIADEVRSMYKDLQRPGNNGHFMLALDVSRWMDPELFAERVSKLCQALLPKNDDNSLRLPGDARWAELAISETDGILIEDHTHSRIDELSRELGLRAFGSA